MAKLYLFLLHKFFIIEENKPESTKDENEHKEKSYEYEVSRYSDEVYDADC